MATFQNNYASSASITLTTTSLADAAYRQSTAVDNTTNKYMDAILGGSIQVGTTPDDGSTITVFLYSSWDGTDYIAGASGSDASYTANGSENQLIPFDIITVDTTSDQDYEWGGKAVAQAFGGVLPSKWGIVILNSTGATTNGTGTNNTVDYIGVKGESV